MSTSVAIYVDSIAAATSVLAGRFMRPTGQMVTAESDRYVGVSLHAATTGDLVAVGIVGMFAVESGGLIAAGEPITSGADGRAIPAGTLADCIGYAKTASSAAGQFVQCVLTGQVGEVS